MTRARRKMAKAMEIDGNSKGPLGRIVDFTVIPYTNGSHAIAFRVVDDTQIDQTLGAAFDILPREQYIDDGSGEFVYTPEHPHDLGGPIMVVEKGVPRVIKIHYDIDEDPHRAGELAGFLRVAKLLQEKNAIGFVEHLKLGADIRMGLATAGGLGKSATANMSANHSPSGQVQLTPIRVTEGKTGDYTIFMALTEPEKAEIDTDVRRGLEKYGDRIVQVDNTLSPSIRTLKDIEEKFAAHYPAARTRFSS